MQPRTKRQREILDYITGFIEEHGYVPSYQQIARRMRIASKSAIANHVAALERQGLISRRSENGSFSLQVRPKSPIAETVCEVEWLDVPPAGIYQDEWEKSPVYVCRFLLGFLTPEKIRAFRVRSNSMIDDHICEGDVALVEERSFARDGDCVVAVTNNEQVEKVVLRRFYRDGSEIELRPANKDYSTVRLAANTVSVRGVFRSLLRPLS